MAGILDGLYAVREYDTYKEVILDVAAYQNIKDKVGFKRDRCFTKGGGKLAWHMFLVHPNGHIHAFEARPDQAINLTLDDEYFIISYTLEPED